MGNQKQAEYVVLSGTFRQGGKSYKIGDKVFSDQPLHRKHPEQFKCLTPVMAAGAKPHYGSTGWKAVEREHGWFVERMSGPQTYVLNDVPLTEADARLFLDDYSGTSKLLFTCPRVWAGTAFVVGGGHSLSGFSFGLLRGQRVIACNDAFRAMPFADVMHYGDHGWFVANYENHPRAGSLKSYHGLKTTSMATQLPVPDVKVFRRLPHGIHGIENARDLGWNGSTGASAINLAIVLGAKRIVLLGFDMCHTGTKNNWYTNLNPRVEPGSNARHLKEIRQHLVPDLPKDVEVLNIKTHPDSPLDCFPVVKLTDVLPLKSDVKTFSEPSSRRRRK